MIRPGDVVRLSGTRGVVLTTAGAKVSLRFIDPLSSGAMRHLKPDDAGRPLADVDEHLLEVLWSK